MGLHEGLFDLEQETGLPIRFSWAILPCHCDREGRFLWKPRRLGAQILPYDNIDFSRVLHAWLTRGFIVKYRVDQAWYGLLPTFRKHQVVNNRESGSDLPGIADACEVIDNTKQEDTDACPTRAPRVPHTCPTESQSRKAEGKGREGKGREDITPKRTPAKSKKSAPYSENFERFWLAYPQPRRKEKPKAWAAWKAQKCEPLAEQIISKLQIQVVQDRDFLDGYEPYPERYLRNRKFEDEINTRPPNGKQGPIPAAEARRRAEEARQQANTTGGRTFDESGQEVFS